ncbi:zinc-ribbon domain-containing protein [Limosilactobacillus antri]|uniref:zinc-ribbon domain-containing protein n=1 Tax=Limosilactobacillus antri TaxID=227943 RepID=UPI001F577520|nr:zinc-ribbon domain-containing protein [Limosilactobacillus antri]
MKFCPNCGAKRRPGSHICAKCGYQFKDYKPAPATKKSGKKKAMAIVIAVIAVCGLTFAFIKHHQDSSNPAIATSSSSQSTGNSDTDSSATPSANTSATAKLSPGESPKLDAASVIEYARTTGLAGWSSLSGTDFVVGIGKAAGDPTLGKLSDEGQGTAYKVAAASQTGPTPLVYTLDSDGTVNFYRISGDASAGVTPLKRISKTAIANYLNQHGDADKVRQIGIKLEE